MCVMTIAEIQQRIRLIQQKGVAVITNYYNQPGLAEKEFHTWLTEFTIIFWTQDDSVVRVFFYSCHEEELRKGLQTMPDGAVVDVISKESDIADVWKKRTGYSLHSVYGRFGYPLGNVEAEKERFGAMKLDRFFDAELGIIAQKDDLQEIQRLLYDTFDPCSDHLLLDDELETLIKEGFVWLEREDDKICTIFIYRIEGKKFYSNISLNYSTADVLYSIQKKALLYAIEKYQVTYFYGWISLSNKQALQKNGNPSYDLYDYVYRKENDYEK